MSYLGKDFPSGLQKEVLGQRGEVPLLSTGWFSFLSPQHLQGFCSCKNECRLPLPQHFPKETHLRRFQGSSARAKLQEQSTEVAFSS